MIIEALEKIIQQVFKDNGFDEEIKVIKSNRPDLCDYQCDNAFKIAKKHGKNPIEIGEKIVTDINALTNFTDFFKEVSFIKPGFINIKVSNKIINKTLNNMVHEEKFGLKKQERETYVIDYGGPNVAKPLHVGHLRTAIIGESLKRLLKFLGHEVIADVHLGDYGLQIGQVIYGVLNDNLSLDDVTLEYLNKIYPTMSALCKEDATVLEKCAIITKELQDGNPEYQKIWKRICEISIADIKKMYDYLGVSFDLWDGESDCYPYIPELTKILESKNLLINSEGALIIPVAKEDDTKEIPPLIYQKSNGAYLYGTTDLAAILKRVKVYNPNHILYVVDARQSLHFEQLFRSFYKMDLNNDLTLKHLGFGTVNDKFGKPFKTRNGDAAKLEDLFEQIKESFINSKESNKDMKEEDIDKIVNAIIKYADLQNNREKDYQFDIEKFSNFVGKTGPYILYTYLRMNKILNNFNIVNTDLNDEIYNDSDRDLRLKLTEFSLSINMAAKEYMPSYIAEYIYELCVLINIFYQSNHINSLEDEKIKNQWLLLITLTNKLLKQLLDLLVIEIPSEM